MSGTGAAWRKLNICLILLSFGCPRLQADNTSSNMSLQGTVLLDLNRTVFINTIVLNTTFGNHGNADYIDVDIGTESCDLFDDKACYITCSSRGLVQSTAYYVATNVTCDVDNVKGRYVRVRQNTTRGLPVLCDVKVMGSPDVGKVFTNFALNAPCIQSSTYDGKSTPDKAVDGDRNGHWSSGSCTHTALYNDLLHSHWWQVDLTKLILVSHIIIANRIGCCEYRLANFTVELGRLESNGSITYTLCRYHGGVAGTLTTLNCTRSIWGQFVRISLMGEALTLCEVEVYGDTDDHIAGVISVIPTSFIRDDVNATTLATSNRTMLTMKSTMSSKGITEAMTSKAQESTVNVKAKVSTMYSELTTTTKVSRMNSEITTKTKVSTTYPMTTTAKVSTMKSEITTQAQVSTTSQNVVTEANLYTEQLQDSQIMTAAPKEYSYCACRCWKITTHSQEEVHQQMKQKAKALKMNHSALGKQVRKKSSAIDQRLSATAMGVACTILFSSIFIVMVLCDVYGLCQYLFKKKEEKLGEQQEER